MQAGVELVTPCHPVSRALLLRLATGSAHESIHRRCQGQGVLGPKLYRCQILATQGLSCVFPARFAAESFATPQEGPGRTQVGGSQHRPLEATRRYPFVQPNPLPGSFSAKGNIVMAPFGMQRRVGNEGARNLNAGKGQRPEWTGIIRTHHSFVPQLFSSVPQSAIY